MHKCHFLRTVFLSTVLVLLTLVLLTPVASAHPTARAQRTATATSQVPALMNVDIVFFGISLFSQKSINCQFQAGQPLFTITNRAPKPEEVDYGSNTVAKLNTGQTWLVDVQSPGTYLLYLAANNQATLTVTVV